MWGSELVTSQVADLRGSWIFILILFDYFRRTTRVRLYQLDMNIPYVSINKQYESYHKGITLQGNCNKDSRSFEILQKLFRSYSYKLLSCVAESYQLCDRIGVVCWSNICSTRKICLAILAETEIN